MANNSLHKLNAEFVKCESLDESNEIQEVHGNNTLENTRIKNEIQEQNASKLEHERSENEIPEKSSASTKQKVIREYKCEVCNKIFGNSSNLCKHRVVHSGQKPFACDVCKKGFTTASNLSKHRRIHTGERPFVCERAHTGEKPFSCDVCGKSSSNKSDLAKHKRIHTKEKKLYACDFCDETFEDQRRLTSHNKRRAKDPLDKDRKEPFSCGTCGFRTCDWDSLIKHNQTHSEQNTKDSFDPDQEESLFSCIICGKKSSDQVSFVRHNQTHIGEIITKPLIEKNRICVIPSAD
ncbi:zinc finger protein 544-like [Chrysoperla carnea]|uniref:zinc finger protein 544-like n=1 Tax=Chrysoperla carnea TaxID=189513 RepID=UPI001D05FED3|nr:zinc finger protein 544-like [Chrysoperla carnea]